jgi:hypothetical protein
MEEIKRESWNKKRIFLAFFLVIGLIILGYFLKTKVLGENYSPLDQSKAVKGTTSAKKENKEQEQRLDVSVQKKVAEKIESIKQAALGLNVAEITSSSPQVQKIINDIKALEQYPTNQAKEICRQICGL